MFFKLDTEIAGEVQLLVTKYIKSGIKAIHLNTAIGCDQELIIRLGKSDGSVRCERFLTGAETHHKPISPGDCILRLRTSHKGLERNEEFSSSIKDPAKHLVQTNKSTETTDVLGWLTRSQSS